MKVAEAKPLVLAQLNPLVTVDAQAYRQRRNTAAGRDLAAYLAHRHTTTTLRVLAAPLG